MVFPCLQKLLSLRHQSNLCCEAALSFVRLDLQFLFLLTYSIICIYGLIRKKSFWAFVKYFLVVLFSGMFYATAGFGFSYAFLAITVSS